jgi:hypothetical protein
MLPLPLRLGTMPVDTGPGPLGLPFSGSPRLPPLLPPRLLELLLEELRSLRASRREERRERSPARVERPASCSDWRQRRRMHIVLIKTQSMPGAITIATAFLGTGSGRANRGTVSQEARRRRMVRSQPHYSLSNFSPFHTMLPPGLAPILATTLPSHVKSTVPIPAFSCTQIEAGPALLCPS